MWSLGGTSEKTGRSSCAPPARAAPLGAGDEELELAVAGGHGHVLVLDVAEVAEDLADGDHLTLEADQVDVAVLALRELEIDGVVPHGQPAGEPEHHAALVARIDDGVRLRHEALVTADGGVERRVVQAGGGVRVHAGRFYPPCRSGGGGRRRRQALTARMATLSRSISPRPMS